MRVTQRGVLAPIRGGDFDFNVTADELAASTALSGSNLIVASVDLGTLEVGDILHIEQFMMCQDTLAEGPVLVSYDLGESGTAVLSFTRGNINRYQVTDTCPLNGFVGMALSTIARVTTGGTKVLDLNALLAAGSGPTGIVAVGIRTGLAVWRL